MVTSFERCSNPLICLTESELRNRCQSRDKEIQCLKLFLPEILEKEKRDIKFQDRVEVIGRCGITAGFLLLLPTIMALSAIICIVLIPVSASWIVFTSVTTGLAGLFGISGLSLILISLGGGFLLIISSGIAMNYLIKDNKRVAHIAYDILQKPSLFTERCGYSRGGFYLNQCDVRNGIDYLFNKYAGVMSNLVPC